MSERFSVPVAGHQMSVRLDGPERGQPVVLIHGMASDGDTWDKAIGPLAERGLRVYTLDLLGHGRSDKPARPYDLDDYALQLDGFFAGVGLTSATLVGHSLGGAIAVHYGYHYPHRLDRLVLVSAGGLGREVHPVLRAASTSVAAPVLEWAMRPRLRRFYASPRLHRLLRLTPDNLVNLNRAGRSLGTPEGRAAFLASVRGVIEPGGQRGCFLEMRYLAAHVPTLVVHTERDGVIPVDHARAAHEHLPGSRLLVFPGGGHEPHRRNAVEFAAAVADLMQTTRPATDPTMQDTNP